MAKEALVKHLTEYINAEVLEDFIRRMDAVDDGDDLPAFINILADLLDDIWFEAPEVDEPTDEELFDVPEVAEIEGIKPDLDDDDED